jgi:hypothetical protein
MKVTGELNEALYTKAINKYSVKKAEKYYKVTKY